MAYGIVPPERDTLTLPGGDTITIKRRLNIGELRDVLQRSHADPSNAEGNQLEYVFNLVHAHLIEWCSVSGAWPSITGVAPNLRRSILNGLDPDDYFVVKDAVMAHIDRLATDRADAKKKTIGTPTSEPISALPSAADGALIGSAP